MSDPTGVRLPDEATERQLLRDVQRWARANGWTRHRVDLGGGVRGIEWRHPACRTITYDPPFVYHGHTTFEREDLQHAVDILVAVGVLPVEFSSAYAAGRRQVLDGARVEYGYRFQNGETYQALLGAPVKVIEEAIASMARYGVEVVTRQVVETEWRAVQAGETPP